MNRTKKILVVSAILLWETFNLQLTGQEKEKSISNKNIQSIRTPIQKPIVKTTSADADSNLILLLISTAVFTIFFVAIAIILVIAA